MLVLIIWGHRLWLGAGYRLWLVQVDGLGLCRLMALRLMQVDGFGEVLSLCYFVMV